MEGLPRSDSILDGFQRQDLRVGARTLKFVRQVAHHSRVQILVGSEFLVDRAHWHRSQLAIFHRNRIAMVAPRKDGRFGEELAGGRTLQCHLTAVWQWSDQLYDAAFDDEECPDGIVNPEQYFTGS